MGENESLWRDKSIQCSGMNWESWPKSEDVSLWDVRPPSPLQTCTQTTHCAGLSILYHVYQVYKPGAGHLTKCQKRKYSLIAQKRMYLASVLPPTFLLKKNKRIQNTQLSNHSLRRENTLVSGKGIKWRSHRYLEKTRMFEEGYSSKMKKGGKATMHNIPV